MHTLWKRSVSFAKDATVNKAKRTLCLTELIFKKEYKNIAEKINKLPSIWNAVEYHGEKNTLYNIENKYEILRKRDVFI